MDRKNKGEVHDRPALSKIGPKIKGIRLSADDKIKQAIRNLKTADQAEFDSFEEADDFDVGDDDPTPLSGYENDFEPMEPDSEFQQHTEQEPEKEKEGESAPKEALEKGADEKPSP